MDDCAAGPTEDYTVSTVLCSGVYWLNIICLPDVYLWAHQLKVRIAGLPRNLWHSGPASATADPGVWEHHGVLPAIRQQPHSRLFPVPDQQCGEAGGLHWSNRCVWPLLLLLVFVMKWRLPSGLPSLVMD